MEKCKYLLCENLCSTDKPCVYKDKFENGVNFTQEEGVSIIYGTCNPDKKVVGFY